MLEARGREIRIGQVSDPSGELSIRSGTVITLNCHSQKGISDPKIFYLNNDQVQRDLKHNDVVYFDDGRVIGIIIEITNEGAIMEVKVGGVIRSNCQVRFTNGKHQRLNLLHPNDVKDFVAISKEIQIDFISVPLIKNGEDIKLIREALGAAGKNIKLLAKIDSIGGIEGYEEILMEADGMIFQRNELQWEHLQSEKLIIAEKWAV